MHQTVDGSIAL